MRFRGFLYDCRQLVASWFTRQKHHPQYTAHVSQSLTHCIGGASHSFSCGQASIYMYIYIYNCTFGLSLPFSSPTSHYACLRSSSQRFIAHTIHITVIFGAFLSFSCVTCPLLRFEMWFALVPSNFTDGSF